MLLGESPRDGNALLSIMKQRREGGGGGTVTHPCFYTLTVEWKQARIKGKRDDDMKNPTAAQNRGQVQTSASPRNTSPNKLDQILRLLKKFNDDMYPPEECEEKGISQPITLVLLSSGAGVLNDTYNFDRILAFESADELEHFLKTTRREQASMIRAGGAREVRNG